MLRSKKHAQESCSGRNGKFSPPYVCASTFPLLALDSSAADGDPADRPRPSDEHSEGIWRKKKLPLLQLFLPRSGPPGPSSIRSLIGSSSPSTLLSSLEPAAPSCLAEQTLSRETGRGDRGREGESRPFHFERRIISQSNYWNWPSLEQKGFFGGMGVAGASTVHLIRYPCEGDLGDYFGLAFSSSD